MMEYDELLQRLAGRRGENTLLSSTFLRPLATYVGLPLLLLLARVFPEVSGPLAQVVQPVMALFQ